MLPILADLWSPDAPSASVPILFYMDRTDRTNVLFLGYTEKPFGSFIHPVSGVTWNNGFSFFIYVIPSDIFIGFFNHTFFPFYSKLFCSDHLLCFLIKEMHLMWHKGKFHLISHCLLHILILLQSLRFLRSQNTDYSHFP